MVSRQNVRMNYQELVNIAMIVISLPVSNAWPERGDSAIKRIKTRLRCSLKNDMLAALLQVSVNGLEMKEANSVVNASAEKWMKMKKRTKLSAKTQTSENESVQQSVEIQTEDASVQTELDIIDLEDKQMRVMDLIRRAAKVLGLQDHALEDENDDDDHDDDDDDQDLFEYE